jgi:dTDP-4-dehydrorhamnose 3,5-epimerase
VRLESLGIDGSWLVKPQRHTDRRGMFAEWYRADRLAEAVGHPLSLAQANVSESAAGVVRGIHFASVPPGQAKYVTCVRGAVLDIVVDLRVGSPTFGSWAGVELDDANRLAVYVPEGLGHGFCALDDGATVLYLCSEPYRPQNEWTVHSLDPDLGIAWPAAVPRLSAQDESAPGLRDVREAGLLPSYAACLAYASSLNTDPTNR